MLQGHAVTHRGSSVGCVEGTEQEQQIAIGPERKTPGA